MRITLAILLFALPALAQTDAARCEALEGQVAQLRADVARLQATVEQLKDGQRQLLAKLGQQPIPRRGPDPSVVYAVPIDGAPMRGAQDAWVTIVEVGDFQCPFTGRVEATLRQLLHKYGSDVRLVYLHNPLPFHRNARPAAIASACAQRQGQFWPLHDAFFDNQRQLADTDLEAYAHALPRLDFGRWKRCVRDQATGTEVDQQAQLAQRFGARGTPSFFINGRVLAGAQPIQNFETLIDAELAKAKASGIPQPFYYRKAVVEEGQQSAP